ncbi:MAG: antitoxin [Verrucomicrobia bacterium]|nr:antitoxin [Verrucomicrobiota bacterium]
MRTTLTIDDDLAAILERETRRKGMSFKELVNSALRRGLVAEQLVSARKRVVTRPHRFGFKPGIDLDKLNQLADELEVEASRNRRSR